MPVCGSAGGVRVTVVGAAAGVDPGAVDVCCGGAAVGCAGAAGVTGAVLGAVVGAAGAAWGAGDTAGDTAVAGG